jgi:hypothetical protein
MDSSLTKKRKTEAIDTFKCFECKEAYDIYGEDQVVPCCGQLLCNKCINKLKIESMRGIYKCTLCDEESLMVKRGSLQDSSESILVNNAIVSSTCTIQ